MRNVTFVGDVDSPFIRGYSWTAETSLFWIFNKINPRDYPNLMENIDFRDIVLTEWEGDDKKYALSLIDNLYYSPKKQA